MHKPPPQRSFGGNWQSLIAKEDDWAGECRATESAFADTDIPDSTLRRFAHTG